MTESTTMARTDQELLAAWARDDRDAGEAFYRRHFRRVERYFIDRAPDGVVDDLVATTFLACVESLDALREARSPRAFVLGIAHKKLVDMYRRRKPELDPELDNLQSTGVGSGTDFTRNRKQACLLRALQRLPIVEQSLLRLYYWEDLSAKEMVHVLGNGSPEGVRRRLHACRKNLRDAYVDELRLEKLDGEEHLAFEAWEQSLTDHMSSLCASIPGG